ncbi:hypothetical protein [Sinorhizobium terangae]|uniref:Uncharacterized protein n=1 Tax=Sinorhizobium terangae TaxID=110322 RepID=A0A6N7LJH3_SINTE|nr:hypothetical protein [Sinorhizobium terangae]MBB4187497.1 hypothetical protein [Sinorhizobium terangae]MQX16995.1 hypothetical protein [Sinorhizobium terangae]WFU49262.1 hypothetical protein QA637_07660 [Sinorhizobium terangae]
MAVPTRMCHGALPAVVDWLANLLEERAQNSRRRRLLQQDLALAARPTNPFRKVK